MKRLRAGVVCGGLAAACAGCESFMRDDADRAAYGLVAQRQREALGGTSRVGIGPGEVPTMIGPNTYATVPPTANTVPEDVLTTRPMTMPKGAPGTAPATQGAATQATTQAAMLDSAEALLAAVPGLKIEAMPELPAFPKPTAAGKTRMVLTLDGCFQYALAHSREYLSRKEDLYLAALAVTLQRHQFEPRLFADSSVGVLGNGESSDFSTALQATQTLGVKQKLPWGGEIVAKGLASSISKIRQGVAEGETAAAVLTADIPLLRGAGMTAQEDLIQAERNLIYEVREFEHYRRSFLVSVAAQYFSLVNQRAQILNRYRNVQSYIFITKRSQALFDAGRPRTSLLDVQRAAQSEFIARSDLINSIASYDLALDNFKIMLGMPTEQPIDVAAQYLAIAPPSVSEADAVRIAQRLRLDSQTARDKVDDAKRGVQVAGNNLLPDLNLKASAEADSNPAKKSVAVDGRNLIYSGAITMSWPLDRVAERNSYRTALITLERTKRAVETTTDQVALDVRSALRQVKQQMYLLAVQKNNIELATRRKAFADMQFRDGKIDNRDYLDAESALLDAQNRFAQALAGLETATLQYLRDTDLLRVDADGKLMLPRSSAEVTEAAGTQPAGGK